MKNLIAILFLISIVIANSNTSKAKALIGQKRHSQLSWALTNQFSIGINNFSNDYDETQIQEPFTDSNEQNLENSFCKSRDHGYWNYCGMIFKNGDKQTTRFSFTNWGKNEIVQAPGFGVGREFQFLFEGFARSDLGLLVWDVPDENESHGHLKLMMFFPRLVMPAIRLSKDPTSEKEILIVTLPTRDEVIFDGNSKEILGGVLNEKPMAQD